MAINFPNSPANGSTHTDGVTTWVYSSTNNSWTVTNSSPTTLSNSTDYTDTISYLNRVGSQNVLTPAANLTYNVTNKTLGVKANVSQTTNMFELKNSSGTILNSFNSRGMLTIAGRIYYQSTAPVPNAADTGLLWYNTTDSNLYVWNGTAWGLTAGGVDLTSNQTISGVKTFSSNILLSSTATISGQGTSKSLVFKPTNSGGTAITALTLTDTTATFAGALDFPSVGTTAKTVVSTLADAQTISGAKTHSGNIILNGSSANICGDIGTDGVGAGTDIRIRANMSPGTRYIKIKANDNTSDGIGLWPKNSAGLGYVGVYGSMTVTNDLTVQGTITGNLVASGSAFGQLASQTGTSAWNVNITPDPMGTLTFANTTTGAYSTHGITITNTSSTSTVKVMVTRERSDTTFLAVSNHKIVLNPSSSIFINATTGPGTTTGTVTSTYWGGDENVALNLTGSNSPVRYKFSLLP